MIMTPRRETSGSSEPARPVRIVLADDHVFVRELLAAYLERADRPYQIVAGVGTAADAIAACEQHQPDILILDVRLPGRTGTEAVPELKRISPTTRVLICSGSVSDEELMAAIRTGAEGFMEKSSNQGELLLAVERLSRGEVYFCPRSSRLLTAMACGESFDPPSDDGLLSPREKQILGLIASGQTSKEIAADLGLSCATVDTHRRNLMRKARARNAAELIRYGQQHGLVSGPRRARNGYTGTSADGSQIVPNEQRK